MPPSRRDSKDARRCGPPARDVPERPLASEGPLATVAVRSPGLHPLIFRKMTIGPIGGARPADGDLIRIVDRDGIPLGFGLWNARSQIPVRILSRSESPPGEG